PLPTAAANASVDMARPIRRMESGFIVTTGPEADAACRRPASGASTCRWSRHPGVAGLAAPRPRWRAGYVDADAARRMREAGYSPKEAAQDSTQPAMDRAGMVLPALRKRRAQLAGGSPSSRKPPDWRCHSCAYSPP